MITPAPLLAYTWLTASSSSLIYALDTASHLSYTLHALIRQTNTIICKINTYKPFQNHAMCAQGILLRWNEVSDAFNHILGWVFLWKMHERNIARPRMPICRVIKISDHTNCWSGESPHCWAAVSREPEFGPEFHDVITMQERGATPDRWRRRQMVLLETAQRTKRMQRYHEFCLKCG
jgi:hypothetical protein